MEMNLSFQPILIATVCSALCVRLIAVHVGLSAINVQFILFVSVMGSRRSPASRTYRNVCIQDILSGVDGVKELTIR